MAKRIYLRRSAEAEKNRILSQLQHEGDRLLKQLQDQFARELMKHSMQLNSDEGGGLGGDRGGVSSGSYSALFSSTVRYLFRPQSKVSGQETSRSQNSQQQFRLSKSQAAAEAQAALARGQKNG